MRKIIVEYFANAFFSNSYINVYKNRHKDSEHIVLQSKEKCL